MGFSAKRLREFERERERVLGRYFELKEESSGKNMNNHVLVKNMSSKNIMKRIFYFILFLKK